MAMYPNEALAYYLERHTIYVKLAKIKIPVLHVVTYFDSKCDFEVNRKSML